MDEHETLFEKFWETSNLDRFNVQKFSQKLNAYDSDDKELFLEYPAAPVPLPSTLSQINKIAKKRKSDRSFSDKQLSIKELGILLSSFYGWNGLEHRGYPSAGATYATEIFCIAFNVEAFSGKVLYYDPEKHGVVITVGAPSWDKASKSLNMSIEGTPNMLIVFVTFPRRAISKYGERGGRFALLEAGAAMQQLSLQVAESSKMKGVIVGGMHDKEWLRTIGLSHTDARIAIGYLVGQ